MGSRDLAGAARALLTVDGSVDSLGFEARVSGERFKWRGWEVPAGRARFAYRPGSPDPSGPKPALELEVRLDSLAHGGLGFAAVSGLARGTRDSLSWFARARLGEGGAFLAGGRFARPADRQTDRVLAVGLDSLALHVPGDAWVLERPVEVTVTDSVARLSRLVLRSAYGSGELVLEGDLPTGGRGDAHFQVEGFPLAGIYALAQRDTSGVGGTVVRTLGPCPVPYGSG